MRYFLALLAFCSCFCNAAESNAALRAMTHADQAARSGGAINWKVLSEQDRVRRDKVRAMLAAGVIVTAEDFFNAALIMQHGEVPDDYRLAYSFASISKTIDPDSTSFTPVYKTAKWLTAAAWDRLMMNLNKPQWYGTQFTKPYGATQWQLYQLDENAVTDEERMALGVMSKAQAQQKLADMNKAKD
jgi:hypothetical protein